MNKKEVQQRVLKDGKPLALNKFSWDAKTKTFSTSERGLVFDFKSLNGCMFDTGSDCTFDAGSDCTFKTGYDCTFDTGYDCTFDTGSDCTFDTGSGCTFKTGGECTFKTGYNCTFDTGWDCTFKIVSNCTFKIVSNYTPKTVSNGTFKTGPNCTFDTSHNCTFKTGSNCTFKTGSNCTFDTGSNCTFDTSYNCTFDTGANCTFKTGGRCVIVRRDVFEVIQPKEDQTIRICPAGIEGHLVDGMYKGEPHIIADGILSKIIKQRGEVYTVVNHGETVISYLVKQGGIYAHGKTIKEAREAIIYKLSDRDTSKWEGLTENDKLTKEDAIQMYMAVTGACSEGVQYFVENNNVPDMAELSEIIKLTQGQYGHEQFKQFVERNVC